MPSPPLDQDLGLCQVVEDLCEDLRFELLVSEPAFEALFVAVLPQAARFDAQGPGTNLADPLSHGRGCELGAVVGTDLVRTAVPDRQISQDREDALALKSTDRFDRQTLAGGRHHDGA